MDDKLRETVQKMIDDKVKKCEPPCQWMSSLIWVGGIIVSVAAFAFFLTSAQISRAEAQSKENSQQIQVNTISLNELQVNFKFIRVSLDEIKTAVKEHAQESKRQGY